MGKPTICIGENKDAVTAKLISAFVFATRIVQFLFYLNPKFQASSSFLCLYRLVCVGPVRRPHCWFSHEAAHITYFSIVIRIILSSTRPVCVVQKSSFFVNQHLYGVIKLSFYFVLDIISVLLLFLSSTRSKCDVPRSSECDVPRSPSSVISASRSFLNISFNVRFSSSSTSICCFKSLFSSFRHVSVLCSFNFFISSSC